MSRSTANTGLNEADRARAHNEHLSPPTTAGVPIGTYLTLHSRVLLAAEGTLLQGDDSVVHETRVAARRVRSALRVFAELFESGPAEHLDRELRWWASVLGPVRDLQVLQDRLDAIVADVEVGEGLFMGPVRSRIDLALGGERTEHWAQVQETLATDRYRALVADVARWGSVPPWAPEAGESATSLVPLVRRADRQVTQRLRRANRSGDIEQLHGARKAAKRARYAAEAAASVIGRRAVEDAKRYEELQDLLGDHRDSVVSAQRLRRLATAPDGLSAESTFALGLLYERERQRGRRARRAARRVARRFR